MKHRVNQRARAKSFFLQHSPSFCASPASILGTSVSIARLLVAATLLALSLRPCVAVPSRPPPWSRFRAVTVLHGPVDHLSYTLTNVAGNLGPEWPVLVVHTASAVPTLKASTAVMRLSRRGLLHTLPAASIGAADLASGSTMVYTRMMTSAAFWDAMKADKVLTFQTDSVLCSMSPWRIDHFLQYDYVGAPWVRGIPDDIQVGNGGLSLRSVRVMRWIIEHVPFKEGYVEDMYFARAVQRMEREGLPVKLAPVDMASRFAFEDEDEVRSIPFGVHRCVDVRDSALTSLLKVCPEAAFGVWSASVPQNGLLVDTKTQADGIGASTSTGRNWEWAFGKAELQKGYVNGGIENDGVDKQAARRGGRPVHVG